MVPDIVKPPTPSIPSAMKGASGPPRSPKDKVTFAEFTDVCVPKEVTVIEVDSCNNTLEVPSETITSSGSGNKVTILETISEHPVVSSSRETEHKSDCEKERLLSQTHEDSGD